MALASSAKAQIFIIDECYDDPRLVYDLGDYPFIPGHDAEWDQGYAPVGSGAALLIGFGAAYLLAKKRKK